MCRTISLINNKGGVGKTTSTGFIAQIMAYLGCRVLVVDLDQQSNLTMMLGRYMEDTQEILSGITAPEERNISDLFKYRFRDAEDMNTVIRQTDITNLDILPSSKRHKNTPMLVASNETGNNNIILKKALAPIKDNYDFILIDNAPANDVLTVNSLFASDMALVPVRLEGFSYKGLKETIDTIYYIKEEHDIENIQFAGTFITQAEPNTNIYKSIRENYQNELYQKFFNTCIRKDVKVCEVETNYCPVLDYCPNSNAVYDYCRLILELNILDSYATARLSRSIGLSA